MVSVGKGIGYIHQFILRNFIVEVFSLISKETVGLRPGSRGQVKHLALAISINLKLICRNDFVKLKFRALLLL